MKKMASDNNSADFIKKILQEEFMIGTTSSEFDPMGDMIHKTYQSFINSGFTKAQAMDLTKQMVHSLMLGLTQNIVKGGQKT